MPANRPPPPPPPPFFFIVVLLVVQFSVYTASSQHVEYLPGFTGKLPFHLETGYIGLGESEETQLFYYFFESERSPKDDPLILWFEGGPGCSSLSGIAVEIGPFNFDYANSDGDMPKLIYNLHSWTKVANIIFLDHPVGAGYSYATNAEAYKCNDTFIGSQIYKFLQKWLINHTKYLKNPLYIAGGSYGGISLPLVVDGIFNGIDARIEPHLNMKGYILGNPITDLFGDINGRVYYAYRMGLLSNELYMSAKVNCKGNYQNVDSNNHLCKNDIERVNQCIEKIRSDHILEPWCDLHYVQGDLMMLRMPSSYENYPAHFPQSIPLRDSEFWCRSMNYLYLKKWANSKLVQEALHIREGTITDWVRCNSTLKHVAYTSNVNSTVNYHKKFTDRNDCRALILSGDHDMGAPHTATEEWIRSLKLPIRSDWRPWFVEGQIAGYTTTYLNNNFEMTYATVKGAGHTATEYKPKECFSMIDRWLNRNPL